MTGSSVEYVPRSDNGRATVSVVIPVYDSPVLEELVERVEAVLRTCASDSEIILVDDASPDPAIWPRIERVVERHPNVRALQLSRNFGQQAATLCGLREARGSVVITMDDDLQHDPGDIPLLLAHSHRDIVIGQLVASRHGWMRRAASRVKGLFDRVILDTPKGMRLSSFRLLSRTVVDGVLTMASTHPFLPALMFHVSRDAIGVPVRHSRRTAGRSGYSVSRLLALFSNLIINNSSVLLRAVAYSGLAFASLSFAVVAWVVYRKLMKGISVQGWASLFAAILLVGGLQLVSMGVIGEYLLRIIETGESKPTYIVRRRSGRKGSSGE